MLTNGTASYATTSQEDAGTLEVLVRATKAGLVSFDRVIVLRTASDFDRAPPNVTERDSFVGPQDGFEIALLNLYNAGMPVIKEIVYDYEAWAETTTPECGF